MGGEGKPVAAHCTPEQKQIAACHKLRNSKTSLGMQAQRNLWRAIGPRARGEGAKRKNRTRLGKPPGWVCHPAQRRVCSDARRPRASLVLRSCSKLQALTHFSWISARFVKHLRTKVRVPGRSLGFGGPVAWLESADVSRTRAARGLSRI